MFAVVPSRTVPGFPPEPYYLVGLDTWAGSPTQSPIPSPSASTTDFFWQPAPPLPAGLACTREPFIPHLVSTWIVFSLLSLIPCTRVSPVIFPHCLNILAALIFAYHEHFTTLTQPNSFLAVAVASFVLAIKVYQQLCSIQPRVKGVRPTLPRRSSRPSDCSSAPRTAPGRWFSMAFIPIYHALLIIYTFLLLVLLFCAYSVVHSIHSWSTIDDQPTEGAPDASVDEWSFHPLIPGAFPHSSCPSRTSSTLSTLSTLSSVSRNASRSLMSGSNSVDQTRTLAATESGAVTLTSADMPVGKSIQGRRNRCSHHAPGGPYPARRLLTSPAAQNPTVPKPNRASFLLLRAAQRPASRTFPGKTQQRAAVSPHMEKKPLGSPCSFVLVQFVDSAYRTSQSSLERPSTCKRQGQGANCRREQRSPHRYS